MSLLRSKGSTPSRPTLGQVLQRMNLSLALIAVGTAGIFLTLLAMFALRAYANHNLHLIARSISYTVEAAVVFEDRPAAREALMLIASNEEVSEAKVLDKQGVSLANWSHSTDGALHGLEQLVAHWVLPEAVVWPITHEGNQIGLVWLTGSGNSLLRFLMRGMVGMLVCLALSTVCALVLSRRMLTGIVTPLDDITNVAHTVRRDRSFDLRVPSAPIAELHELSCDFNCLLDEIEAWQAHLQQENDALTHQATHDSLTGLPNRAFFENQLGRALTELEHDENLAVLFIDGNHFKEVNDNHGHAAGDTVLITIAERLRSRLRKHDLVARMGGDEFAILLAPLSNTDDVLPIADNIIECMQQPIVLHNKETVLAALSIGIAFYPEHASTPQDLLHEADDAMYRAKHLSHGGWRLAMRK
ncbi:MULTISPECIES: diguanylate cyclase domain-containing protein [unclassified Serratia (in: enterobacteria)]|uniref:diguanylate cyclase domain-containing protein n=1 Tax=unclassified Serratia (in: enterobacteria) TaxID=2647522 RepID=UPI000469AC43|nr:MULTISPECIES: diguanylate cyclase [unclassified Serratia (in: enterobacteria)]